MATNFVRRSLARASSFAIESARKPLDSRDGISARIDQVAFELGEISKLLARGPVVPAMPDQPTARARLDYSEELARRVRLTIRSRNERTKHFPDDIFADPAWDMLLDLFHSDLLQHRTAVTDLCIASKVPHSTALRWIATLTEVGLVARRPDPLDRRRVHIELTDTGRQGLYSYFDSALSESCLDAH